MKTYLFCNAHLDPVWLWQWEQGFSEALSTFRSAADLVDEYPGFIFNHNESLLYGWVEEHEPELFERIRRQVTEGRWEIVGGWFLQPDCNMPSGEAIVRQALRGRLYFYDKFGKVPVTAVNFDSFGHAQGLVQVLRQCGYKYYVNIRPGKDSYDFPEEDFLWQGYDGSQVIAHRSNKGYNSVLGKVNEELPGWMAGYEGQESALYCWGVGNHGGGPSRKDLDYLKEQMAAGADIVHATPDQYFATVDRGRLRVVNRGLNPLMEGCYTSIIRIKQLHRRLENDLVMTEKMAAHAAIAGLSKYEKELLDDAWTDLMFAEFHDSLPGSCIQPVEEDMIRRLQHGLEITNRLKAKYFVALSAGQPRHTNPETVPLLVYNPHPFAYTQAVDMEFVLPRQMWDKRWSEPVVYQDGSPLPSQSARESGSFNMDWCKRVIFTAKLPAASMSRFEIRFERMDQRPAPTLTAKNGAITVETARGWVRISTATGLVDSWVVDGVEYLRENAFSVDVYEDFFGSWDGKPIHDPRGPIGRFQLMTPEEAREFTGVREPHVLPVRVTDEGEVNTVVEADLRYHESRMVTRYIIDRQTGFMEIELKIFNGEREKRFKLRVPTALGDGEWIGQTMFGREKLKPSYGDTVNQYWQALCKEDRAVLAVDDGIYGSYCGDGALNLTLLRSAGYGASIFTLGEPYHEPMYTDRMEQGERRFRFRLLAGDRQEMLRRADREAAMFNQRVYALAHCPSGRGEIPRPLVEIDHPGVTLSCFKRSEREENTYVLRMFESQGEAAHATVTLPALETAFETELKPFEIKTFLVRMGEAAETDMLEGAVPIK